MPPGQETKPPEVFICDGQTTMVFGGNGRSGWVGDTLYVATEIHFSGTFTPVGGAPQTESFDKVFGNGPGGGAISCAAHIEETSPEGTFVGDVQVFAVPVPGH